MDRYQFPHILHISECLEAIKGCDAFYVAERDRHTIINYHAMGNDVFPPVTDHLTALRRECRGIVFGPDGSVIARRLHKFFNAGEHPEVALDRINLCQDHVVLEKLDGSMITPIPIGDTIRWGTKMGLTEVGFQAEEFVAKSSRSYVKMAEHYRDWRMTPIFEWCSRKQRIVIDYPQDDLVLIALRNNITGSYIEYEDLVNVARFWNVPIVKRWHLPWGEVGHIPHMEDFVNGVSGEEGTEGYVVRFKDGHSVKVKSDWYVRIHRAKDSILQEKRVVEMVLNEKVDDVLPHLIDHDRRALSDFQMDFWRGVIKTKIAIADLYRNWYFGVEGDKKRFAIEGVAVDQRYRSMLFSIWGVNPNFSETKIFDELKKRIGKNLGSQTNVDGVRWAFGGVKWADYIKGDENGDSDH